MKDQTQSPQDFAIVHIYVKDCSFEAPVPMHQLDQGWDPEADIDLSVSHTLGEDRHEVVLLATVKVSIKDETIFVAEVKQGGTFLLKGFTGDDREHILESFCATILFPYARQNLSDMISRAGFPPLYLNPVDFEGQFQQKKQAQ